MPSASRVSAAWRRVAQSDWLPITIATGFAAIRAFQVGDLIQKEGADYKNHAPGSKAKGRRAAVNLARLLGKRAPPRRSRDDVGGELVLDEGDAVAQEQLALFEPLHLERIGADRVLQRADGGVEVPVLLLQAHERRAELAFFLFGHRRGAAGSEHSRQRTASGRPGDALSQKKRSNQELPAPGPPFGPEIPPPSPFPVSRFGRSASSGVALWHRIDQNWCAAQS